VHTTAAAARRHWQRCEGKALAPDSRIGRGTFSETLHSKILPRMAYQMDQGKGKSAIVVTESLLAGYPQICGH
jgi:hypothetical protein